MPMQRMLDYERARKAIAIPKEAEIRLTLPYGAQKDVETLFNVIADTGQAMIVTYFELTTPPEVEGNIILETGQGYSILAEPNQIPNTNEFYDPSDYGLEHFYVKAFSLYAKAVTDLTDDRTIILKFSGARGVL